MLLWWARSASSCATLWLESQGTIARSCVTSSCRVLSAHRALAWCFTWTVTASV